MNWTALNTPKADITTQPRPATFGQMKDISSMVIQAVPEMTFEEATICLRKKGEIIERIRGCFPKAGTDDAVSSWELFYREIFGLTADFSQLKLPPKRPGFDRLIIVAKGLTLNQVYETCAKHFPCWRYTEDLNTAVPTNDRTPTETYAIWVRDRIEADEELKNLSADDLSGQKTKGVTLLERMLHELKYFLETGKHLDIENWTLCNGSRDSGGDVPSASWRDGGFKVCWYYCRDRDPYLRSREAVSL